MRRFALASFGVAALLSSGVARAAGGSAVLGPTGTTTLEQRVAVASSSDRTTIWTSASVGGASGAIGVVVPAPAGTSVDVSTDAWLEALEVATTPRVLPPANANLLCPGDTGTPKTYAVAGDLAHVASASAEVELLADEAAVEAWASANGLAVPPSVAVQLNASGAAGFVAMKVDATSTKTLTPTLRLVMPGAPAVLPLALTSATAGQDVLVTTWLVGGGRASLSGAAAVSLPDASLAWNAKTQGTNYEDNRHDLLVADGTSSTLVESAGHAILAHDTSIADGTASIDDVLRTYFERAAAYDATTDDPDACASTSASSIDATSTVANACPRAALGVVGGGGDCVDGTVGVAPSVFRCGPGADDVAVALSGLAPANAWVTRASLVVPAGDAGLDFTLAFSSSGNAIDPIFTATSVDLAPCNGGSVTVSSSATGSTGAFGTSGPSSGAGGPTGTTGAGGSTSSGDQGDDGSGSGTDPVSIGFDVANAGSGSCDCGGDTGADDSSSGCDSGSDSGSSCGGDSSDGGCDSGGGSGCDSGGGDGCSGGGGSCDCEVGGAHDQPKKKHAPRLSILMMLGLALAAPLRRRTRKNAEKKLRYLRTK